MKRENTWKEHMQYHFEERIQFACSLIDFNQVSSVIDLGCGKQALLTDLLANNFYLDGGGGNSSVSYIGMDLYKHCRSTVVKDFNNGDKIEQKADVIFALGLLSYIYDIKSLIADIYDNCQVAIVADICKEEENRQEGMVVNRYSRKDGLALFINAGFIVKEWFLWKKRTVFVVSKYKDKRFLKNPITGINFCGNTKI